MSLQETFANFWTEIRQSQPFAGQPCNEASAAGVAIAREALRLATEAGDDNLLLDAWRMAAYSLTANQQYAEALPYYAQALDQCEKTGDFKLAAKVSIGFVSALTQSGKYDEGLKVAAAAEHWLKGSGDSIGYARLCTKLQISISGSTSTSEHTSTTSKLLKCSNRPTTVPLPHRYMRILDARCLRSIAWKIAMRCLSVPSSFPSNSDSGNC
jgi:tetratricopeptide (TPR) repeat protein